jgi:hypothetical protein
MASPREQDSNTRVCDCKQALSSEAASGFSRNHSTESARKIVEFALIPKRRQSMPASRQIPSRGNPPTSPLVSTEMKPRGLHPGWLLVCVLINVLIVNPVLSSFNAIFIGHHNLPSSSAVRQAIASNLSDLVHLASPGDFDNDSLGTMLPALKSFAANPQISPYQAVFFRDNVKFQYPLTSLLPLYFLQRFGVGDDDLSTIFNTVSCIALLGILLFSIFIALRPIRSGRPDTIAWSTRVLVSTTIAAACLFFYPITRGLELGQIQTILTFGFTAAFYCWISGRERASGAILGVMSLVKPQYAFFLVWAALRKRFGAFVSCIGAIAAGVIVSICVFGFHNNMDYLKVLHFIGMHGESYTTNQSMNGLLNRLLFNGDNLIWDEKAFAPFNPIVYAGTLVSFLALVGFSLFFPCGPQRKSGADDFACCLLVATMASPVAWEHHYGILFPIFIWLYFGKSPLLVSRSRILLIAVAYFLTSDNIRLFDGLATIPVLNVFQSYLFFGALIVLMLLLRPTLPETIPASLPRPCPPPHE